MTLVKICGITTLADMTAAIEAGADFLGFICYPKSPRYVTRDTLMTLMELLRGLDAPRIPQCVGVFVDPDPDEVYQTVEKCRLQAAQIHRASPEKMQTINTRLHGVCYPAIQPRTFEEALIALNPDLISAPPWIPQLLIDAYHPELAGGTGKRADLEIAHRLTEVVSRLMVAGGLSPDNVGEVLRVLRPWAVDVSSGVEYAPGKKDHALIRAFIQAVREASQED